MLKRSIPEGNFILELDGYINRSGNEIKGILDPIRAELKSRYGLYNTYKLTLEHLPECTRSQAEKNALHNKFKLLRGKEEIDRALRCPYCQIQHARTLDHFMPKENFPDFSIYRPNLIWVCASCNSKKGNSNVSGTRSVLNPYFDDLDSGDLLQCNWYIDNGELLANFSVPYNSSHRALQIARRHMELFELHENFIAEANNLIDDFCIEVVEENESERNLLLSITTLIGDRNRSVRRRRLGNNHWERLLWQSARYQINVIQGYLGQHRIYNMYYNRVVKLGLVG